MTSIGPGVLSIAEGGGVSCACVRLSWKMKRKVQDRIHRELFTLCMRISSRDGVLAFCLSENPKLRRRRTEKWKSRCEQLLPVQREGERRMETEQSVEVGQRFITNSWAADATSQNVSVLSECVYS